MEIALVIVTGVICLFSFVVGAKVGQTVSKGEEIKTPVASPFKTYQERIEKRQAQKEQERIDTIMQNIEKYDGTDRGQADVPNKG